MRTVARLGLLAVALLAGVAVACTSGVASVAPATVSAPSTAPAASPTTIVAAPSPSAAPSPTAAISPVETPAVLQVACDGTHTSIVVPVVRAQPDGVHLRFDNTSGIALDYSIEDVGGDSVPIAGGAFTFLFAPGTYRLSCAKDLVGFEVVDPAGIYNAAACADPGSGTTGTSDYGQGATGMRGTVLDVARRQVRGLTAGDVIELAGYPQAKGDRLVRVVHGTTVLAALTYADDGHGRWLLGTVRMCLGSHLKVDASGG